MSVIDEVLESNRRYARHFDKGGLRSAPERGLAVLACMDARLDVHRMLGLEEGDAHVIRNAGGAVTEDAIRSLLISRRLLGTEEIMVIQHTGCGMLSLSEDAVKAEIERDTGLRPPFALEGFPDLDQNVRQSLARLDASPFLAGRRARGFVYDVATGALREIQR